MKICITGHTRGIGKATAELLAKDGHEIVGASMSTGVNVLRTTKTVNWILKEDPDVFVNNVYAPDSQVHILYKLYEQWQYKDKHIINLGSTSADSIMHFQEMGFNKDWTPYVSDKARLNFASLYLSERFNGGGGEHKCKVTNLRPGFVNTSAVALFKAFMQPSDFLEPAEVATYVKWIIDQPKHIQIKEMSFNTGNSHIPLRRERQYETKGYEENGKVVGRPIDTRSGFEKVKTDQHLFDEETGIQYGQNLTQTWEPKEK
tara:strand:+ start:196 stop:975 length:780 start_codon:yes stop_codon:yes gene_type:complete